MVVALVVAGAFVPDAGVFGFVVPFGRVPAEVPVRFVSEAPCVGSVICDSSAADVETVLSPGADVSGSFGSHAVAASAMAAASASARRRETDLRANLLL